MVSHDETGWDWDRVSSGDGSHVTVRLHYPLTRPHAVPGVRGSNGCRLKLGESLHLWAGATRVLCVESPVFVGDLEESLGLARRSGNWGPPSWATRQQSVVYA